MDEVRLNWAQAEVRDASLSVSLEGKVPKGWKDSFERTIRLLGNGEWGKVELNKQTVKVGDVAPGSEGKLHHYLEGVVEQANAAHRAEEQQPSETDDEATPAEGPDAEMTERFRAFAEPESDGKPDGEED